MHEHCFEFPSLKQLFAFIFSTGLVIIFKKIDVSITFLGTFMVLIILFKNKWKRVFIINKYNYFMKVQMQVNKLYT